jgi:hypothetical protein
MKMYVHLEATLLLGLCFAVVFAEASFLRGLFSAIFSDHKSPTLTSASKVDHIAIFIQAFSVNHTQHNLIWDDITSCVSNVGKAQQLTHSFDTIPWENVNKPKPFTFDVYISIPPGVGHIVKPSLEALGATNVYVTEISQNIGMDIKQFIEELQLSTRKSKEYKYFLKIHSKSSLGWRQQALESLCGTPAQILTVLHAFGDEKKNIGAVVPQGLTVRKSCNVEMLYRPLRTYYKSLEIGVAQSFTPKNVANMQLLYKELFDHTLDPDEDKYACAAGTMFWAKFKDFKVKEWVKVLPWLEQKWTQGYVVDEGIEHAIERLFITIPFLNRVNIAEIIPAPKTLGIYFPQYHRMPENDAIHGEGFTEWTLLKPSPVEFLAKPLPVSEGGLGYYDLTSVETRRRQGELAKAAGLHGFMYYHYWFAGKSSFKYKNPVMGKIPELMLQDGEPNLPFMFSWANEPWTSTWSGGDGRVFLPQNYGGRGEWTRHFNYLLPFFEHPNYIRVANKPAFAIYRVGLFKKNILGQMLILWRKLARDAGLDGLHIIYTLNNFVHKDKISESKSLKHCDASFQFFPTIAAAYPVANASSTYNIDTRDDKVQYWGGFTGFSNRVRRRDNESWTRLVPPAEFKDSVHYSFKSMSEDLPLTSAQVNTPNLFFMTAWNEWNEQAQLEPSDKYKFAYLSALKSNLENLPMTLLK